MKIGRILWRIGDFVKYRLAAVNEHGVHSPFVFGLLTEVIRPKNGSPELSEVLAYRQRLLTDQNRIASQDYGAGSTLAKTKKEKSVAEICRHSAISPRKGALLFRLARHFSPNQIIELGTNLGLGTAYLAAACPEANIQTIEGNPALHGIAAQYFRDKGQSNVHCIQGRFDLELPGILDRLSRLDFAFVDGDHTYDGTLKYFEWLLRKAHADTVLVFDDIHWSADMNRAWAEIIAHPKVVITLDLYDFGLVFFRTGVPNQHFVLR